MAITTCLWFNGEAEEAAKFYVDVFTGAGRSAKLGAIARFSKAAAQASGQPENSAMTATFELEGQDFLALNGGPHYKITPAISFVVKCDTQKDIDYFWQKFGENGGQEVQCGWINDKFGVSWQVVPTLLSKFMTDPDPSKPGRVMAALMQMKKLDIAKLQAAYEMK